MLPRDERLSERPRSTTPRGQVLGGFGRDGGGLEAAPGSAGAEKHELELTEHEGASLLQRRPQAAGAGAGGGGQQVAGEQL